MRRLLEYRPAVERDLARMDQSEADRITLALQAFALESRGDVKALKGALKGRHRLRVGKWRAILSLSHDRVVVLSIDNRGEAY